MPRAAWCDHPRLSAEAQSPTAAEDGDAGQCQVQLESPSWRNFLAHFGWENPNGWFREQKLSVAEAIEAYTMGSGYAEFEEQEKGLITIGRLVDRVPISRRILDRPGKNPRRSSSENICRVKIDLRCRCNREVTMVRAEMSEPKCLTDSGTDGRHWGRSRETTSRFQCQSPACSSLTTRWMFRPPHGRELSRRIHLVRRDRSRDRGGPACISDRIQ